MKEVRETLSPLSAVVIFCSFSGSIFTGVVASSFYHNISGLDDV